MLRRVARDESGDAYLWVVSWDDSGYHFRTWRMGPFDVRAFETWQRMMALRRSNGLPELPPPDLRDPNPCELSVVEPEHARPFLVGQHELALDWHASQFFDAIENQRP